jgi:hypothetical protein
VSVSRFIRIQDRDPPERREVSKEMAILSIWESHLPRSAPLGAPR